MSGETAAQYATRLALESAKKRVFEHDEHDGARVERSPITNEKWLALLRDRPANPSKIDGEAFLLRLIKNAKRGRSNEEIEHDVQGIIDNTPYLLQRAQREVHLVTLRQRP